MNNLTAEQELCFEELAKAAACGLRAPTLDDFRQLRFKYPGENMRHLALMGFIYHHRNLWPELARGHDQ